jgi:transcriptional regulator with XRE-family HTH domain
VAKKRKPKNPALVRIGENLRKAREKRGLSQEELAFEAGVHRTYVGGVERAEYNVTVLTLLRFTKALGITLQDAIRGL